MNHITVGLPPQRTTTKPKRKRIIKECQRCGEKTRVHNTIIHIKRKRTKHIDKSIRVKQTTKFMNLCDFCLDLYENIHNEILEQFKLPEPIQERVVYLKDGPRTNNKEIKNVTT